VITTATGPTCPTCGSLVIPSGCVNCGSGESTAREVAHAATAQFGHCVFGPGHWHWPTCDALTAAIEARDARSRAEVAAYKRAKAENDDRFMTERDAARAEARALRDALEAVSNEADDGSFADPAGKLARIAALAASAVSPASERNAVSYNVCQHCGKAVVPGEGHTRP
jgi:ribosomal protein L32